MYFFLEGVDGIFVVHELTTLVSVESETIEGSWMRVTNRIARTCALGPDGARVFTVKARTSPTGVALACVFDALALAITVFRASC